MRGIASIGAVVALLVIVAAGCGGSEESAPKVDVTLTDKPMSEADAAAVDKVFTSGYTAEAQKAFPGLWVGIWDPEKGHHDPAAPRHDERDSRLPQRVRTAGSSRSSPPTPRPSSRPTI